MKIKLSIVLAALLSANQAFSATINLYDQPKNDAKAIGSIDTNTGIIPIYAPKGDWVKVGDPRNGNVGWIKTQDFKNLGNVNSINFSQRIVNTNQNPQGYQVMQMGAFPQQLTPEQSQAMFKDMEARRRLFEREMHQMMDNMFRNNQMMWSNMPMIVPVILVPQNPQVTTKQPTPPAPTTAPSSTTTKR